MIHPLGLPEIRARVAAYLDIRDAINCACVSKDWNSTFLEHVWSHIALEVPSHLPTIEQIRAHSSHIRTISLRSVLPDDYYLLDNLHRLYSLQVAHRHGGTELNLPFLGKLIENHSSSLEQFQLSGRMSHVPHSIFNALGTCRHLKSITLHNLILTVDDLKVLLINCANIGRSGTENGYDNNGLPRSGHGGLSSLVLDAVRIQRYNSDDVSTLPRLPNLEYLAITKSPGILVDGLTTYFTHCPNVKSFHWTEAVRLEVANWVEQIESGKWSDLTCLDFVGQGFGDNELFRMIESLPLPLEKLRVESTFFGRDSFRSLMSLERHYTNLRELNLSGCWNVTSGMVQQIMTKMPLLESLFADYLCVTDVLDASDVDRNGEDNGQDWICKNIRTLRLCINLGGEFDTSSQEYDERQRHVYRRLSNLKLIEILEVGRNFLDRNRGDRT
ncbi:hypothetical protein BGZ80_004992 [Entomortierella chlamydospora]|uniref:F-box domain-containing protein n=1 Tax=Entomortierella chlamydospora TaxID=101097 RepID=A0A9P6SVR4_9FUNG|nr:hypothetical protein BGZ80_004992 [Entomortierella chlamydospora]